MGSCIVQWRSILMETIRCSLHLCFMYRGSMQLKAQKCTRMGCTCSTRRCAMCAAGMVRSSPPVKFVFMSWEVVITMSGAFKLLWSEQDAVVPFLQKNTAKLWIKNAHKVCFYSIYEGAVNSVIIVQYFYTCNRASFIVNKNNKH